MNQTRPATSTDKSDLTLARLSAANHWLRDEIERLRLTDAEREAVEWFAAGDETCYGWGWKSRAATLRGLLERFSDRPKPIATPNPPSTPAECAIPPEWLSRPYYVDPPSGWQYGFPKLYDPQADGDLTEWLIAEGYPERFARQGLPCTFSEYRTESGGK